MSLGFMLAASGTPRRTGTEAILKSSAATSVADVTERPGRLAVGIVGIGRVGAVLGAALTIAGHRVVAGSGVSNASRRRAAELLPGVPLLDAPDVASRADLVLLTVPDDALP